jgi:hypothetical protein
MDIPDNRTKKKIDIEQDVEFEFEVFGWNRYELEDGTILKACHIPVKMLRTIQRDIQGFPIYLVLGRNIVTVHVPPTLHGVPSTEAVFDPTRELMGQVEIVTDREVWNIFKLVDGTILKTRLIVNKVLKSKSFNQFGEPVYTISSNVSQTTNVPDQLRSK